MVDKLQMAVQESLSHQNTQSVNKYNPVALPVIENKKLFDDERYCRMNSVFDSAVAGKIIEEFILASKDDRINTKRSISANIASTARVQNQNAQTINACKQELRRKDLTEEQRVAIIENMVRAAESTSAVNKDSRAFQQKQLEHSHNLTLRILGGIVLLVLGGLGGAAIARAVA